MGARVMALRIDYDEIRRRIEAMPEKRAAQIRPFAPEEDKLILEFWDTRIHEDIARELKRSKGCIIRRYRELKRGEA